MFTGIVEELGTVEVSGSRLRIGCRAVLEDAYQQIRRARKSDVRMIYNLTRNAVRREELVHRTQQAIEKNIEQDRKSTRLNSSHRT